MARRGSQTILAQQGVPLPIALGAMLVISIALVTVLEMSLSNQRNSNVSKADQSALGVADAGRTRPSRSSLKPMR